jgi:acyl-CoA thioester hydrolase
MFNWPIRIYWEDTDAGGIVFYANYLKFMERARTEWLRSLSIEQQALRGKTGGMFVVTETALRYLQPARLDDQLLVSAEIVEKGRATLRMQQKIWKTNASAPHEHGIDSLLCEGTICIAWVDAGTLKPGRIPTNVLERIS